MTNLTTDELNVLLEADAAELAARIDDLTPDDLAALAQLEQSGAARAEVLQLLDDRRTHIGAPDESAAPKKSKGKKLAPGAKQERGEEIAAHLKPDYNGPLTIDLLEQRRRFFEARGK